MTHNNYWRIICSFGFMIFQHCMATSQELTQADEIKKYPLRAQSAKDADTTAAANQTENHVLRTQSLVNPGESFNWKKVKAQEAIEAYNRLKRISPRDEAERRKLADNVANSPRRARSDTVSGATSSATRPVILKQCSEVNLRKALSRSSSSAPNTPRKTGAEE